MRNIRAWDDIAKKMSYGKIEQFDDMLGYRFDHFETEKPVYMWSIGIKDMNGKDIFIDDIFPSTPRTRDEVTIICYDSRQGRYKAVPLGLYKRNAGNGGWTGYDVNPYSEVIGNVHEHPHLLEESK
jgi:hypothetical protein